MNNKSLIVTTSVKDSATVFAANISFPRGLKFGPDGYLYVALAGSGGTNSTVDQCTQVIPSIGPYKGCNASMIVKISSSGVVSTVVDKLPSNINALGFTTGAADIEFVRGKLYILLVGGCSHGNTDFPSVVLKFIKENGTVSVVDDLSTFVQNDPVIAPELEDFEPDGDPYSLINVEGVLGVAFDKKHRLYVLETSAGGGPTPMTGRVVRINKDNTRDVIVDKLFFPTGMTFGTDGALYISNTGFGSPTGSILKVVIKDNVIGKGNEGKDD